VVTDVTYVPVSASENGCSVRVIEDVQPEMIAHTIEPKRMMLRLAFLRCMAFVKDGLPVMVSPNGRQ